MTDTNPYRSPMAGDGEKNASNGSRTAHIGKLFVIGIGAVVGVLLALPLLMMRVIWAFALPIAGAALGGLIARAALGRSRGARKLAICVTFLTCGPVIGLSIGFFVHKLAGEPLVAESLGPYIFLGLAVGTAGALGSALTHI